MDIAESAISESKKTVGMIELISESAKIRIEEWVNNSKTAINSAEENALSAQKMAAKMQLEAKEAITKAEQLCRLSQEAADEAIKASKEAAEASRRAASEAGEMWVNVFKGLLGETTRASLYAKQTVEQTSDFVQDPSKEVEFEYSRNNRKAVESNHKISETVDDREKAADDAIDEIDDVPSVSEVPESKVPGKEFQEKTKDRLDSLTKMLMSDSDEE